MSPTLWPRRAQVVASKLHLAEPESSMMQQALRLGLAAMDAGVAPRGAQEDGEAGGHGEAEEEAGEADEYDGYLWLFMVIGCWLMIC